MALDYLTGNFGLLPKIFQTGEGKTFTRPGAFEFGST